MQQELQLLSALIAHSYLLMMPGPGPIELFGIALYFLFVLGAVSAIVLMVRSLRRIARNSDRTVDLLDELLDERREE